MSAAEEEIIAEIREIAQACKDENTDTPGGVEHLGDFRRLILRWEKMLNAEGGDAA